MTGDIVEEVIEFEIENDEKCKKNAKKCQKNDENFKFWNSKQAMR